MIQFMNIGEFWGCLVSALLYLYRNNLWSISLLYRHVMLPKEMIKLVPRGKLMSEQEWRSIGVQQSQGWVHYMLHAPEPHVLLFRRPISDPIAARKAMAA